MITSNLFLTVLTVFGSVTTVHSSDTTENTFGMFISVN